MHFTLIVVHPVLKHVVHLARFGARFMNLAPFITKMPPDRVWRQIYESGAIEYLGTWGSLLKSTRSHAATDKPPKALGQSTQKQATKRLDG
jgi:hypothetical protein